MTTNILVADPNQAFAAMIKDVLEESGRFAVVTTSSGEAALTAASLQAFDLAVLEMELEDIVLEDLVAGLRSHNPMMAVMLIPPFGDELPPGIASLDIQGALPKPFFIPELENIIDRALLQPVGGVRPGPRPPRPAREPAQPRPGAPRRRDTAELPPTPPWLQDVNKAARYLTTLSLESAAEASLLTRGNQLYAYAGHFPREEAEELARIVAENWARDPGTQGALVRFVQLSNGLDYLLYSTLAAEGLVLSMVFQAETPLGMIRKQARRVAVALLTKPENGDTGPQPAAVRGEGAGPEGPRVVDAEIVDTGLAPVAAPDSRQEDVPPPITLDLDLLEPVLEPELEAQGIEEPAMAVERELESTLQLEDEGARAEPAVEQAAAETPGQRPSPPAGFDRLPIERVYRTPHGLYTLSYTFLWLPKLPHVTLKGDLVERLDEWVRHLALAYDWRVEQLDVQPEYVQLVIACAPADSPEKVVQTMMQTTSRNIMVEFPRLAEQHPAGSFWAPGYYVMAPGRLLSADEIKRYVDYQRREQGLKGIGD